MKLLRAQFQNFRLLRDLEIEFSSDPTKKLTVIRAANESGKTTILLGLLWALYGDTALPGKGEGFRLHPIDWDASDAKRVPITTTVEFELTTHRRVGSELRETQRHFRLIRSTFETVGSHANRKDSTVQLFELKTTGASPIPTPEARINEALPPQLKDVFFTDGDRALSFIEADVKQSTKRERVQRAIRSLLGLEVIEDAIKHVRKSAAEVNKKVREIGPDMELRVLASQLETLENEREITETKFDEAQQQFVVLEEKVNEIEREISAVLQKGDKEKLNNDLTNARREIKELESQFEDAKKEHSNLFRSKSLVTKLLAPVLASTFDKLDELRDQGKIPNTTIPVLKDRLSDKLCICGETLDPHDSHGKKRRAHIQNLIDESERSDEVQEIITKLYYSDTRTNTWFEDYSRIIKRRDGIKNVRDAARDKHRSLEVQLDSIPNTDIQGLRDAQRNFDEMRYRYLKDKTVYETQLKVIRRDIEEGEDRRDYLLREQKKGAQILAEVSVTQDIVSVLQRAYKQMTTEELQKVSELMNKLFLEMIGADPEQGAIIRRTEIGQEFDIIVYGPRERTLNPDRDLNGASRRALTLAFILALTKVSEVEAPNVIDTPLGMTSDYVKRSILRTAVRESSQLILLLTPDEIHGCEEIIDAEAGLVLTLTNPAHFPKILMNDPRCTDRKILRCSCDHRSECSLCQRVADEKIELELAS